jgi:serine protease Do
MIVRGVGSRRVRTPLDWEAAILRGSVGTPMDVRVAQGSGEQLFRVVPTDLPSMSAERIHALRDLQLVSVTPAIRAERNLQSEEGALVVSLSEQARQIGLREGDVILAVNRARIRTAEDAARVLQQIAASDGGGVFVFERGGQLGRVSFGVG